MVVEIKTGLLGVKKMITLESNIKFLQEYNDWRTDERDTSELVQPNPREITENIDFAINKLRWMKSVGDLKDGK